MATQNAVTHDCIDYLPVAYIGLGAERCYALTIQ